MRLEAAKVYIRVDGSVDIGMGHLIRCVALAHMLKNDFSVSFVCRAIPEQTKNELTENDFDLLLVKEEKDLFSLLNRRDTVVLDGYGFDLSYQQQVRSTGAAVVCIDDMHDTSFDADLIINHAPGVSPVDYKAKPYTKFALGTGYALLRPAFLQHAKKKTPAVSSGTLMICFGGADGKNLTAVALEAAVTYGQFKKINVVTGPAYQFLESLQPLLHSNKNIVHQHAVGENEMLQLMTGSDVAIVPASGILYEVLCAGCKIISGTYVENQQLLYKVFKEKGAFISAGNFSKQEIINALQQLDKTVLNNTSIIDGLSPKRIVTAFYDIKLTVRTVTADDCKLLFDWANDTDVRRNAINKKPIEWEGHNKWFHSKLENSNTKIFILEYNGSPAGQVRYDYDGIAWVIDYSIDKKYRGKGFGRSAIGKTIEHFKGSEITAMVLEGNVASSATFEKLNFIPAGSRTIEGQHFLAYKFLP